MKSIFLLTASLLLVTQMASAAPLDDYRAEAKAADPSFSDFSAEKGKAFFLENHTGGKPETPSCTSCHTKDPKTAGQTRAGKTIEPMALSVSPTRYSDKDKVEKWFRRNCNSVLGRACSALEKGNFITFMQTQ
jgi:cytochrome c peroxidase